MKLIFPPHPGLTWHPKDLSRAVGYIAQYKYDDWRTLVYRLPSGEFRFYSRKKTLLPRFKPPAALLDSLSALKLPKNRTHVLDGGLLHYKTQRIRNTIVLWDLLVLNGELLVDTTYRSRYRELRQICRNPKRPVFLTVPKKPQLGKVEVAKVVSKNLWLAPWIEGDFERTYQLGSQLPEVEGLVLKDPDAKLKRAYKMENNASWQIRVRKPSLIYRF